jgi:hypothetical protein
MRETVRVRGYHWGRGDIYMSISEKPAYIAYNRPK